MKEISTALVAFQAEMPTVHKGKTANVRTKDGGSYKYTYADLADVTKEGMPRLTAHGLAFTCSSQRLDDGTYELRGVLLHTSGEDISGSLPIHGHTPQELGSSLTYARRYLFGCLTGIVTDDDDDAGIATAGERRQKPQPDEPTRTTRTMSRAKKPPPPTNPDEMTGPQQAKMMLLFNKVGITQPENRHDYIEKIIGRPVARSTEITKVDASKVIDALEQDARELPPADEEPPY